MTAYEIYKTHFPEFTPNLFQQDQIEMLVEDMDRWTRTMRFWALNGYRPGSIGKMLEYYAELAAKRRTNAHVGKHEEAEPMQIEIEPCEWCGAMYCLKAHDVERRMAA